MREIPRVPPSADRERRGFDEALRERLELIGGRRGGRIKPLSDNATTAEIAAKINELIERLQG